MRICSFQDRHSKLSVSCFKCRWIAANKLGDLHLAATTLPVVTFVLPSNGIAIPHVHGLDTARLFPSATRRM
jgi:hypothetical protein